MLLLNIYLVQWFCNSGKKTLGCGLHALMAVTLDAHSFGIILHWYYWIWQPTSSCVSFNLSCHAYFIVLWQIVSETCCLKEIIGVNFKFFLLQAHSGSNLASSTKIPFRSICLFLWILINLTALTSLSRTAIWNCRSFLLSMCSSAYQAMYSRYAWTPLVHIRAPIYCFRSVRSDAAAHMN